MRRTRLLNPPVELARIPRGLLLPAVLLFSLVILSTSQYCMPQSGGAADLLREDDPTWEPSVLAAVAYVERELGERKSRFTINDRFIGVWVSLETGERRIHGFFHAQETPGNGPEVEADFRVTVARSANGWEVVQENMSVIKVGKTVVKGP